MCGIAGWLGALSDGEKQAALLVNALHHRGPNAQGVRAWPEACLVHTRLSIIDLSPAGAQPMANEDGSVWTVCNGEIYNHKELRRDLETRGHVFRGHSDTEVVPHLYEEYGIDFVAKLRGMFGFAIYDSRTHKLFLVRDRFGIKPLFFSPGKKRLAFASEINALLTLPDIDRRPDRQAVFDFAALYFIPAPETFYIGIRALEPGSMLEAQYDKSEIAWKTYHYHQWTIAPDYGMTLDRAVQTADALVTNAVRRQLESDVPLGSLLSGGIDSSLVSAAAQAAMGQDLRTFNVRFPEKDYDETWAAQAVAAQIGSHHQTLEMDDVAADWDSVTRLLLHAGQPFADTSLFAVNAICRLMRQHVTVALSGDGGDEAFGGYNFYGWISLIARLKALPRIVSQGASMLLTPLSRVGAVPASLPQRLRGLADGDETAVIQDLFCWTRENEHRNLCIERHLLPLNRLFEPQWQHQLPAGSSRLERLSTLATEANVRLLLPNDFLFKVDTASMKESMEVRVPMLDEDLFSFALTLPHRLKVTGSTCKTVLRHLSQEKLPATVADKPKQGFSVPLDTWVDDDFKVRLRQTLLASKNLPEFFHPDVYQPMIEAFCEGRKVPGISRDNLYQRAIMFLSVHLASGGN